MELYIASSAPYDWVPTHDGLSSRNWVIQGVWTRSCQHLHLGKQENQKQQGQMLDNLAQGGPLSSSVTPLGTSRTSYLAPTCHDTSFWPLALDALSGKMRQWLACLAATSSQDGPTVAGVQGFYALQDSSADFEFGSLQSRSGSKCTLIVMLFIAFSQQCLRFTHRSRQTYLRWAYRPLTASIQWWCSIHSLALLRILVGQLTSYTDACFSSLMSDPSSCYLV